MKSRLCCAFIFVLLCAVVTGALVGCKGGEEEIKGLIRSASYESLKDFDLSSKTIGVITGTITDQKLEETAPGVQIAYFSQYSDMLAALQAGKIDGLAHDEPVVSASSLELTGLSRIDEAVFYTDTAFLFPKTQEGALLCQQVNEYLASLKASDKFDVLKTKWLAGEIIDTSITDYKELPAPNGTITYATNLATPPFDYLENGLVTGYEFELLVGFCEAYGYGLNIMDTTFDGVLAAASTGKCDIGACCISITEERSESVYFSTPIASPDVIVVYNSTEEDIAAVTNNINTLDDLEGKRVGTLAGSAAIPEVEALLGDSGQLLYFNSIADLPAALKANKIDAFATDRSLSLWLCKENPSQKILDEEVSEYDTVMALNKNTARAQNLCDEFNAYLAECRQNGTLDSLEQKWMESTNEDKQVVEMPSAENAKDTIVLGTATQVGAPHCYVKDGAYVGYDIDLMASFCREKGYALEIVDYEFMGLLSAVSSGKCDFAACDLTRTDEREETLLLTDSIYDNGLVVVVNKSGGLATSAFIASIVESFEKTFVKEGRWKLFLTGVFNTLIITLASLILGTLLGYLGYLLCRHGGRRANRFVDFCVWFITGMPTVVLLMILFYIVFGSTSLSGVVVSIIGFTLIFATSVIGMLKTGVSSVEVGQEEAAQILGYTRGQTFRQVVLPQAVRHALPLYKSEIVTILKGTAIVGYIAVQDLTKVGDIIRSRTYEAFFPLIAVAVIYFVLAAALKLLMNALVKKVALDSRSKDTILKGVDVSKAELNKAKAKQKANEDVDVPDLVEVDELIREKQKEPEERQALIELRHISKVFDDAIPLRDLSATIYRGDAIAVIGPSGCGKTTLLRCITLLQPPTSGQIILDGEDLTASDTGRSKAALKMGMVFQRFYLFAHWTALENVMNPQITILKRSRQEAYENAVRLLESVGVQSKMFAYPADLSGGQQQRVAIARTLAMDPEIILFDEPTSALDPASVGEVQRVIRRLGKEGCTMMIVTHEMRFAREASNRVFYLDQGTLYEEGNPEQVFKNPQRERTQHFMRQQRAVSLETSIRELDLPALYSCVDLYAERYRLSRKNQDRLLHLVEELCEAILAYHLSPDDQVRMTIDYEEVGSRVVVYVDYTGREFDPRDSVDDLAKTIMLRNTDEFFCSYKEDPESTYNNHVRAMLQL